MNQSKNNEYFYVEKNKFISNYLIEKFKLWIWDFDDTLIDTTTYYKKSMEPEDIIRRTNEELDIEFPNWRYFVGIVNYLVSRGVRVGIASFGTYKIIKAYMDRIFGFNQKIFTETNLKALCRDANGKPLKFYPDKNEFIEEIMKFYKIYEPIKIILFDDNMTNISNAMHSGIVGVKIIGKNDNEITNRRTNYSDNTYKTYFGECVVNKLENTLKRLEQESKEKEGCPVNNLKNETFSAIGSRKVGTINKTKRLEREKFLQSIKDSYDKEQENTYLLQNENNSNTNTNTNTDVDNIDIEKFENVYNKYLKNKSKKIKYLQKKPKLNKNNKKSNKYKNENFNINNNHSYLNNKGNGLNKEIVIIILIIVICILVLTFMRN